MNELTTNTSDMVTIPTDAVNQNVGYEKLLENLECLKLSLMEENEDIPNYVKQIHKDLLASPELIHMLNPEQVNILVQGIDCLNDFSFAKSQETKVKVTKAKAVSKKESLGELLSNLADAL